MSDQENSISEDLKSQNLSSAELLKEVNQAIKKVSTVSSYKIGSRSVQYSNLTELKNLRKELAAEVASENSNNGIFRDTYLATFEGR